MTEYASMRRPVSQQALEIPRLVFTLVTTLFFLSGAAGLVYQVLWMRSLGLFFGSDMHGVTIILSTFMGGLALGGLLGGRIAERTARPLLWYGVAELALGLFAPLFASILQLFDPLLVATYPQAGSPLGAYQLMRVMLASGTLLVPTTMMGATLPLIMRHFVRSRSALGRLAGVFYGANTFGALVGTLIAGFVLLPRFGMSTSTLCAATINCVIGVACIVLGLRSSVPAELRSVAARADLDTLPDMSRESRLRFARAAIGAIAISGFCSFALEVVWTRILLVSFSATVYAFSSMLACFLFGIFVGSIAASRFVDRSPAPLLVFAALEVGAGLSVGVLCLLINAVPEVFGGILGWTASLLGEQRGNALVVSTLLASFALLSVPTTLLGATFPVALRVYTTNVTKVGRWTGNLYAANTCGAILGSAGAGLVLIPTIGARGSLVLLSALFTGVGIYLAACQGQLLRRRALALAAAATSLTLVLAVLSPYRVTLNFNQNAGADIELLYHGEGVQNTIDVVRSRSGVTSLIIGGNVEADNGYTQRRHFILKGHLPLMFLKPPISVLVVGLGMGVTLKATASHPGVESIDVIELSPEILEAQAHLREINGDVVADPRVKVRIDDGRSHIKMARSKYDMITADPIHPKISRVGYLYTKEYYESMKRRLVESGVVCQWMPLYQISPRRLRSAMKTFAEVFPNATFWYVKNHGLFVAKRGSFTLDYRILEERFRDPAVRRDLDSIDIGSPEEFLSLLLMGPEEIRAFVDEEPEVPINSDDYPYLEYFVPGDLFYQPRDIVEELVRHQTDPTRFVVNQPLDSILGVRERIRDRASRLVEELKRRAPAAKATHRR